MISVVQKALGALPPFKKVVVGVSGGADSVALALILKKLGYTLVIAHLNHGLRGKESDGDERFVKQLAASWGVPCVTHKIHNAKTGSGNLENRLRQIRYGFLETVRQSHHADFVAVAHHRDDQIETILMHMERGAGLRGLRGMPLCEKKVIRPLLELSKKELTTLLRQEKIAFRTDESNFDTAFRRNHFRHVIIPTLKKEWKTMEADLLALASSARRTYDALEADAQAWIAEHVSEHAFPRTAYCALSGDLQSEILFQLAGREDLYRASVDAVKALILKGANGKQKKLGTCVFRIDYDLVALRAQEIPQEWSDKPQKIMEKTQWGDWNLANTGSKGLLVRSWKPGDRFKPSGMLGTKKLQDFFVDLKIPQHERHRIPIIINDRNLILGIGNLRVARNAGYLKKYLRITRIRGPISNEN